MDPLPEPLLAFDPPSSGGLIAAAQRVDALLVRYQSHRDAGRVLPNSVEAVRVELTYHSNAIEGSTLTLRDTQLVIEGREPNTGKTLREIYEARNHDRALRTVEGWAATRSVADPLTEQDLFDVHAEVLADIAAGQAGRYRADRFSQFVPPLLGLANRPGVHPVVQAAELHYNLVAVHPFADGNGRTDRLLMNYHLLRRGFPHTVIPVERRAEYLTALEEANAGRSEPFTALVFGCVEASIRRLIGDDD